LFHGQAGRKETALDLAKFVDKGVQVKLTGGRQG
jgi:U6 snRNA-associated Sm-like protein LSm7